MRFFIIIFMLLFAVNASAQGMKIVDANTAKFTWEYSGPTPVDFRIKCGTASGVWPNVKIITDTAARSYLFKDMGFQNGIYYCVMTAMGSSGKESPPTTEIFFSAGVDASIPVNFGIGG
jgi:hypothetical protein